MQINAELYKNNVFEIVEENTGYLPVEDHINSIQILVTDPNVSKAVIIGQGLYKNNKVNTTLTNPLISNLFSLMR